MLLFLLLFGILQFSLFFFFYMGQLTQTRINWGFFFTFFFLPVLLHLPHMHTDLVAFKELIFFVHQSSSHFLTRLILSNLELPVVNPLWRAATELSKCAFSQAHIHTYICECE